MGWMPRRIAIHSNRFTCNSRCCPNPWHTGTATSLMSVIGMAVVGPHGGPPAPFQRVGYRGIANISIQGNTIEGWYRGPAVRVGDARGVLLRGNHLSQPPDAAAAVVISDTVESQVEGNHFHGQWGSLDEAIQVQNRTSKGVVVQGNTLNRGAPAPRAHSANVDLYK